MALTYLVGVPRSGKSYYAVYQLWKNFVFIPKKSFFSFLQKKQKHDYEIAYTNINQFDFSKSPKIKKLDFDELKNNLTILHGMYLQKKSDNELIEKAKEFNLYKSLICIDEVQNFVGDKVDDTLVWWITYHGHLFQDLFFITQDLSLINPKYKNNAEFFYNAVPPSKRLSIKRFRYTQYANYRMANNGKISDFTIPALKEVFGMYVSGAENKSKSILSKYIYFVLFTLILSIGFLFYFIHSFSKSDNPKETVDNSPAQIEKKMNPNVIKSEEKIENFTDENDKLFIVNWFGNMCSYNDVNFPISLFNKVIQIQKPKFFLFQNNKSFTKFFVVLNKDSFNFIQKVGNDDDKKNNKKDNSFSLLGSSNK